MRKEVTVCWLRKVGDRIHIREKWDIFSFTDHTMEAENPRTHGHTLHIKNLMDERSSLQGGQNDGSPVMVSVCERRRQFHGGFSESVYQALYYELTDDVIFLVNFTEVD